MKKIISFVFLFTSSIIVFAQTHLMIGSAVKAVASGTVQLVSDGDIRTDGTITCTGTSVWNFKGSSLQKVICLSGSCANNYSVSCTSSSFTTNFMNLYQDNPAGIEIETNSKISGTHTFNQGICQIDSGTLWYPKKTFFNDWSILPERRLFTLKLSGTLSVVPKKLVPSIVPLLPMSVQPEAEPVKSFIHWVPSQ